MSFELGRRRVGLDEPTYFVADIAANHDGDLDRARLLIRMAAEAGADAAKFQHFSAASIVSGPGFDDLGGQVSHQSSWRKPVVEVYRDAELPLAWTAELRGACDDAGIDFMTAPYDLAFVPELSAHVVAWKVGSGDITWHEEIEVLAADGKPVLIATGASDMDEVRAAVAVARKHNDELVLMQCNTNYTGDRENLRHVALNVLRTYAAEFPDLVLGLSDHTPGHVTVLGAVTLGARVIEKHFTDDVDREGPDHRFSMDQASWAEMVDRVRDLEAALGPAEKVVMPNEYETVVLQRRAVRAAVALPEGHNLTAADLSVLRPCPVDALPPHRVDEVLGRRTVRPIAEGDVVRLEDVV
jgi:sialic acid synthase SpsE